MVLPTNREGSNPFFLVEISNEFMYCYHKEGAHMILTIDIGNTNTVFVEYDNGIQKDTQRVITKKDDVYEYYYGLLVGRQKYEAIIASCVVPRISDDIEKAVFDVFGQHLRIVNASTVRGFVNHLDNPLEIGADFIATSIGVDGKYPLPAIIADVGSATKLTYIEEDGSFSGGVILPGIGTSMKSLSEAIPHLPEVPLVVPDKIIGHDTVSSIQSGSLYGLIAGIEGIANRMAAEKHSNPSLILTGGYGQLIKHKMSRFVYDEYLVNEGLKRIYEKEMIA